MKSSKVEIHLHVLPEMIDSKQVLPVSANQMQAGMDDTGEWESCCVLQHKEQMRADSPLACMCRPKGDRLSTD